MNDAGKKAGGASDPARRQRLEALKGIIRKLHAGESPDTVRAALRSIVRQTTAEEIAAMEQELMSEGISADEIQSMCDLHSSLVREILAQAGQEVAPGHPVDTFRRENAALRERMAHLRAVASGMVSSSDPGAREEALYELRQITNDLFDVEKHYQRKEQLLFPYLERRGVTGPTTVMWGKDDEARTLLKGLAQGLAGMTRLIGEEKALLQQQAEPALAALEEMIVKEEQILLPMAMQKLSAEEWGEIWRQSPEYGWCLVEPREGYAPPKAAGRAEAGHEASAQKAQEAPQMMPGAEGLPGGRARFATGQLTVAQLTALFGALPVDLTFVDADDRVAFFSPGERVFPRSRAILGRRVQQCHPPKSVATVERILSDFRAGRQSVAEFWIEMRGRFVHIRYFAMRDDAGGYLGTLEVVQDATRIRSLSGQQRLLQYGTPDYFPG